MTGSSISIRRIYKCYIHLLTKSEKKVDSRYTLVILAAKRSRDIIDGMPKLTEADVEKPVSIAANEIAEDLITYRETM